MESIQENKKQDVMRNELLTMVTLWNVDLFAAKISS